MTKKLLIVAALLSACAGLVQPARAAGSPTIVTSTMTTAPASPMIAAPASGFYTVLTGCVFSNGYSSGECVTIASSVSSEPSLMICAPSTSTVVVGQGAMKDAYGQTNGLAALFGGNLSYTGSLTVTGTATQAGLLTCGYRVTNAIGK